MLNNKKTAMGFICVGIVAIIAAIFVSVFFRKPYFSTDIPKELEEAVTSSIFKMNDVSMSDIIVDGQTMHYAEIRDSEIFFQSECLGEGHMTLGYTDRGKNVEVYVLCSTVGYGFRDGLFVDNSGSFCIPTLIKFDKSENGEYIFKEAQESLDGGAFASSVRNMFPASLAEKAIEAQGDDEITDALHNQCDACAAAYLQAIGRKAKIGSYNEEDYKLLSDFSVSDDVCNKLSKLRPEYGFLLGSFEKIEDGVRYVYSVKWDGDSNGKGTVTYAKTNYETGKVSKKYVYKVEGDKFTEVKAKAKKKK